MHTIMKNDVYSNRWKRPLRSTMLTWLFATSVVFFLSGLASAQVVIDDWSVSETVNAGGGSPNPNNDLVTGQPSILGGSRHIIAERVAGTGQFTSQVSGGQLSHGAVANQGVSVVIWDGRAIPGGPGDANEADDIDFTGLDGENLTADCPENARAISFRASADNNAGATVTVDVYSNSTDFSTGSAAIPQASVGFPISIPFSGAGGFTLGSGATNPADFTSVGAIRLTITTPNVNDVDVKITSAVSTCGYDLGDAYEGTALGSAPYYTTTSGLKGDLAVLLGTDIRNNTATGPAHRIGGPYLGAGANDTDDESDGQPNTAATGDDIASDDEDGVSSFPTVGINPANCDGLEIDGSSSLYCVAVEVNNPTADNAQLAGWVDFSGGGVFSHDGCASSVNGAVLDDTNSGSGTGWGCDRAAETVRLGTTGLSGSGSCGTASMSGTALLSANTPPSGNDNDWTTGNIPANCSGTVVMVWDMSAASPVTTEATYARFRITTDTASTLFSASGPAPFQVAEDGEIEDYRLDADTLPVSIHSFDSRFTDEGLVLEWGTVSETRNAGFYLWGDFGNGPELLLDQPIGSRALDAASSQRYAVTIPGVSRGAVSDLIVTAVDTEGNEEVFGMFEPGKAYGRKSDPLPIAWGAIRQQVSARMAERAYAERQRSPASGAAADFTRAADAGAAVLAVDFKVASEGMQQITWQDLRDAGLDLTGVANAQIAVTLDGEPVARHVLGAVDTAPIRALSRVGNSSGSPASAEFGPGGSIRFWGIKPEGRDALYLDDYVYRISVDPELAVGSKSINTKPKPGAEFHLQRELLNEDLGYSFTSPLDDPWYAARLRAGTSNNQYTRTIQVDQWLVSDQPARLDVVLAGGNNEPISPNHHARILVNGQVIDDVFFTGSIEQRLSFEVPAGLLQPGDNTVSVAAPGGTDAQFDIVVVDRVALNYPRRLQAVSNRLLVERARDEGGVTAHGFTTLDTVAYAWDGEALSELKRSQFSRGSVRVPTVKSDDVSYWISAEREMHRPAFAAAVGPNELLDGASGDLVIIGHPAFLPLDGSEPHPLNDYLADRIDAGWNPVLFDITEIQTHYGNGMTLPQAVNRFLADADAAFEFEHVLLIGSDSYDYSDNFGLGSISFIPTHYAATRFINYTPSDALLADLNGNGLADKAVGRWPVRTLGDLQATVSKTLDWAANGGQDRSAIWVTDSEDPNVPSFLGQANRMFGVLENEGWPDANLDRIFWGDVEPIDGLSIADSARAEFFNKLEQGRALTGFSGHGAPTVWTFQGLLTPTDFNELYNEGKPTLIGTLTCYTSYFVSPFNDTVAHRWMNGYREDAAGNQIPGVPNGAVAIHGAATLSNYAQNEVFAGKVLEYQLEGLTLGQSVERARAEARSRGIEDLVINWTLLGDPTITIQQ